MAKAGRPKKGSAGLPAWFDIEKYRVVKDFKAINWFEQLAFRKALHDCPALVDKHTPHEGGLSKALSLIKTDPVITENRIFEPPSAGSSLKGGFVVDDILGIALRAMHVYKFGVQDMMNENIAEIYADFPNEIKKYLETSYSSFADDGRQFFAGNHGEKMVDVTEFRNFLHKPAEQLEQAVVSVDLSLADEALKNEFTDYLKNKRKQSGKLVSPFFKNPDFKTWYNSGVLPYLDLKLSENLTGESVRWAAFANVLTEIIDSPVGSESALTKTTTAHAKKLMDVRTLRILQSQALREKLGSSKESGKLVVR